MKGAFSPPVRARKQTNGPPGADQVFSTASCNSCHSLSPRGHPPPPVPRFLLAQNLSSKRIAPTDNISRISMTTIVVTVVKRLNALQPTLDFHYTYLQLRMPSDLPFLDNYDNHENYLLQDLKNPASPCIEPQVIVCQYPHAKSESPTQNIHLSRNFYRRCQDSKTVQQALLHWLYIASSFVQFCSYRNGKFPRGYIWGYRIS